MNALRRKLLVISAGLAALAGGLALALHRIQSTSGRAEAVERLFAMVFDDPSGQQQPLAQWKGKWLVINFWATWCAPCIEEMPMLQQVARDYAGRGVVVIGLGIDSGDAIRRFQSQLNLDLPLLVAGAKGTDLARELGNPGGALPYTVLVSPGGVVVQARLGLLRPELLRSWLDTHLAG